MAFLSSHERTFLQAVAAVAYCNPFLPERIAYERQALGTDFVEAEALWNLRGDNPNSPHVNPLRLAAGVETLVGTLRERLAGAATATPQELVLYEDAVLFLLLYRYADRFYDAIVRALEHKSASYGFYAAFERDWAFYFHMPGFSLPTRHEAAHLFACFFQVRRAFANVFRYIVGISRTAARLLRRSFRNWFRPNYPYVYAGFRCMDN